MIITGVPTINCNINKIQEIPRLFKNAPLYYHRSVATGLHLRITRVKRKHLKMYSRSSW